MAYEVNRRAVMRVVNAKCRKKFGSEKAPACYRGVFGAFERSNRPGFTKGATDMCREFYEFGDPDLEAACISGAKMFGKGIDSIGPRLAGKKRRR